VLNIFSHDLPLTKYPEDDLGKNQVDKGYNSDDENYEYEYDRCVGGQHLAGRPDDLLELVDYLAIEKSYARENIELALGLIR
jgi:hypothetical protein